MTVQITRENFTAAMRAAVAERGEDWVYPERVSELAAPGWRPKRGHECVYVLPDGSPACLIGLALYKIDPALVEGLEGEDVTALRLLQRLGLMMAGCTWRLRSRRRLRTWERPGVTH